MPRYSYSIRKSLDERRLFINKNGQSGEIGNRSDMHSEKAVFREVDVKDNGRAHLSLYGAEKEAAEVSVHCDFAGFNRGNYRAAGIRLVDARPCLINGFM